MTHRVLHLSDPHLAAPGVDNYGVDAGASLDRILYDARFVPDIDLVVVSGDLADDGSVEGYVGVLDRVGRFAAERGIPHVYTTGNHDIRKPFASVLGSGHLSPDGTDIGRLLDATSEVRAAVSEVSGLRVITLDSLVPGSVHGHVGEDQLEWLRTTLAEPAPAGTIVVLHHPPIAVHSSPFMKSVGLRNPADLGAAVAGSDVHVVLCGHFHLQLTGLLQGVPVWATPGVITRIDLTALPGLDRAVKGAGATVVDLGGPASPMFHTLQARDPEAGAQVYLLNSLTGAVVEDESASL
ncbi:metallophosphoesterase [Kribbella sp. NBC_01245]|uniref:metallophosphoesterase family protein n=1 Tax=Kribbella sp. NBC_01245 TaxID=2903578 RepID=UPI002E27B287|nr:metallophosphoesterase [Kribbella sp. NBC_01245]